MDKKLLQKLAAIALMALLLLIPLSMVEHQITARSQRQNEVQASIANSAAGPTQSHVWRVATFKNDSRPGRRASFTGCRRFELNVALTATLRWKPCAETAAPPAQPASVPAYAASGKD